MALKPNQLQVTVYHPANSIIERVHKFVTYMLRSFELEKNNENIEEQEDNTFDYFLQLHGLLEAHTIQHYRQHHVNL
jgi:hypothetical protein